MIAFVGDSGLETVSSNGHDRRTVFAEPGVLDPAWSPDGEALVFTQKDDLWLVRTDGTGLRQLTSTRAAEFSPAWSPDGRAIAFAKAVTNEASAIYIMAADGTELRPLTSPG
jgi:TolB protein